MKSSASIAKRGFRIRQRRSIPSSRSNSAIIGQSGTTDLDSGAKIQYTPGYIPPNHAERLFRELRENITWKQQSIVFMGRTIAVPRLIAYFADDCSMTYSYSGQTLQPLNWHPAVLAIKDLIEKTTGSKFNVCLLNFYRNGRDSLSWHSDNEKEFGEDPTIASLTLGSQRDFMIRRNVDRQKWIWKLGPGDLLIMSGTVQKLFMHAIPKRAKADERINLTFRYVV